MIDTKVKKEDNNKLMSEIRDGVTLIDFNAEWCVPCKEQKPIVDKLKSKYRGRAFVFDLDVDEHPDPALALGITSIPTLIVFKNGNEFQRFIGIQSEDILTQSLDRAIQEHT